MTNAEMRELKEIIVSVYDKNNRRLMNTNLYRATKLVNKERAIWIDKNKSIVILKAKNSIEDLKKFIETRAIALSKDKNTCYICKEKINRDELTVDHVLPKCRNGSNLEINLRCCCKRCNNDKDNMTIEEYYNHVLSHKDQYDYIDLDHLKNVADKYKDATLEQLSV